MAYRNQALWNILEYLAKSVTPDQLLENTQLVTNLAYFCSALVDQVQLQAFPAGKYKVFKFIMKYLRQITVQYNGTLFSLILFLIIRQNYLWGIIMRLFMIFSGRVSTKVLREAHRAANRITVHLLRESQGEADELLRILKKVINHQGVIIAGPYETV
jgi:hypothetical protein